jgi:hypothetical protein
MDNKIILIKLDNSNIVKYKLKILSAFKFHPDLNRSVRERGLLEETIKLVQKNKTILYLLVKEDELLGLIALSASSIEEIPVIQVDYLFVSYNYRREFIKEIGSTVSEYLISFAIKTAETVKQTIGVKYIALYPDAQDKNLISHYQKMGFFKLNKYWLVIKLK